MAGGASTETGVVQPAHPRENRDRRGRTKVRRTLGMWRGGSETVLVTTPTASSSTAATAPTPPTSAPLRTSPHARLVGHRRVRTPVQGEMPPERRHSTARDASLLLCPAAGLEGLATLAPATPRRCGRRDFRTDKSGPDRGHSEPTNCAPHAHRLPAGRCGTVTLNHTSACACRCAEPRYSVASSSSPVPGSVSTASRRYCGWSRSICRAACSGTG